MLLPPLRTLQRSGDPAAENRVQILLGLEFGEPGGVLLDAETVASAQAGLVKFSDHDVQS